MQVVLIILSVGLLGLIIYFAFSPKSSRQLKRAAFIALGLIALALIISGIFLILGPGDTAGHIPIPGFHEPPAQEAENSIALELIIFILVFLFVMGLIIYSAYKEQHKKSADFKNAQKRRSAKS